MSTVVFGCDALVPIHRHTLHWSKVKSFLLEVITLVKRITSIADANKVLRMVREGRAVPVSQLRTALLLIDDSRKTLQRSMSLTKKEISMLERLLAQSK